RHPAHVDGAAYTKVAGTPFHGLAGASGKCTATSAADAPLFRRQAADPTQTRWAASSSQPRGGPGALDGGDASAGPVAPGNGADQRSMRPRLPRALRPATIATPIMASPIWKTSSIQSIPEVVATPTDWAIAVPTIAATMPTITVRRMPI